MNTALPLEWAEHLISALVFSFIGIYTALRYKNLRRNTQRSIPTYFTIISISVVLALLNIIRVIFEPLIYQETPFTLILNTLAIIGGTLGQTIIILYLLSSKIIIEKRSKPARILAIGAHPDDIEIAAGATLAKMCDAGYFMVGLVLSHGEQGGDAESRLSEAKKGAKFLELDDVRVLDFNDTHMIDQAAEITQAIEKLIKEVQPDMIFTHSKHDIHQDHQAVHESTMRAARNLRSSILCYESPSVTMEFFPTYFVDACGYVDIKIEAINQHWDQHTKPYMRPDVIRGKLSFRGSQAKIEYAEGFEVARMVSGL
jgi:LmbE family N-acetylglucosaminyl deacetylase